MSRARFLAVACLLPLCGGACTLGLMQTAETLPPGRVSLAASYAPFLRESRVSGTDAVPDLLLRLGIAPGADLGLRAFGAGALVDLKLELLRHAGLTVSLDTGLGAGSALDEHAYLLGFAGGLAGWTSGRFTLGGGLLLPFAEKISGGAGAAPGGVAPLQGYGLHGHLALRFRVTDAFHLQAEWNHQRAFLSGSAGSSLNLGVVFTPDNFSF